MKRWENTKMKKVKIDFVNFGEKFDKVNNMFYHILSQRYEVEISRDPEYIIYYPFGIDHLKYDCIRIFWTAEQIVPDFNICDYALGYEYLNYEDRYQRHNLILNNYNILEILQNRGRAKAEEKTKFCNFIYGNTGGTNRKEFFKMLSEYKAVDSCGRLLNNMGYYLGGTEYDKIRFQKDYKFTIAFENASMNGYTTEKLLHALAANTIPIYWGNPRVIEEFNPKAYINCNDYNSFEDVIEKVKEIDCDDFKLEQIINEPVFCGKSLQQRKTEVEKFIYHIFDQDIEHAFRRSKGLTCPGNRISAPLCYSDKAVKYAFYKKYIGKKDLLKLAGEIPGMLLGSDKI